MKLLLGEHLLVLVCWLHHLIGTGDNIEEDPFQSLDDEASGALWGDLDQDLFGLEAAKDNVSFELFEIILGTLLCTTLKSADQFDENVGHERVAHH